jgi:hypothetical protein
MNNFAERTWLGVVMEQELQKIMATYIKNPPRKVPRPNVDPTHTAPAITSAIPQIHIRTVASLHAYLIWHVPCLHTVADSTTFLVHLGSAELRLQRTDYAFRLSTVRMGPRAA